MGIGVIGATVSNPSQYEELITTSSVWTKPAGVKTAEITVAGGGGGSYSSAGGAGFYKTIIDIENTSTIPITIGATGTVGGTTVVGDFVACTGGSSPFGSDRVGALGSVVFASQKQASASNGVGIVSENRNVLNDGQNYNWRYKVAGYDLILMRDATTSTWVASKDNATTWTKLDASSSSALDAACFSTLGTSMQVAHYVEGSPEGYVYTFDRSSVNSNVENVATSVDGITWVNTGPGGNVYSATMAETATIVSTNTGVYVSTNNGTGWTQLNSFTNCVQVLYVKARNAFVMLRSGYSDIYISYGPTFTTYSSQGITSVVSPSSWGSGAFFKVYNQSSSGQALLYVSGTTLWFYYRDGNGYGYIRYFYLNVPASGNSWSGSSGSTYGNASSTNGGVNIAAIASTGSDANSYNKRSILMNAYNPANQPYYYNYIIDGNASGVNGFGRNDYGGNYATTSSSPFLLSSSPEQVGTYVFFKKDNLLYGLPWRNQNSQTSLAVGSFWGGLLGTDGNGNYGTGPGAIQQGGETNQYFKAGGAGSPEGWCAGGANNQQSASWQYGSPGVNGAVKIRYWR